MEWLKKITDFIMPIEPMDEEEEIVETKKTEAVKEPERKVESIEREAVAPLKRAAAGGGAMASLDVSNAPLGVMSGSETGSLSFGGMKYTAYPTATAQATRPQLTVVKDKAQSLNVRIYAPTNFDQVSGIADDILSKNAAIVNYERVDGLEQRRICDFINGVCYVTNGAADRISEKIVLYVPEGVDAENAAAAIATSAMRF